MIISIPLVEKTLQTTLNETFGENVFILKVIDKQNYLEYVDSTPQSSVDQAVILADENAQNFLQNTQLRLFQVLNIVGNQVIAQKEKPPFNDEDVQQATLWLQDQTLPCPGCVLFLSIRDSISKQQAAENVINYQIDYQNFITQVNSIKVTGQNNLMNTTNIRIAKSIAQSSRDQLENLI